MAIATAETRKYWLIEVNDGYSFDKFRAALPVGVALRDLMRTTNITGAVYVHKYQCKCSYCGQLFYEGEQHKETVIFGLGTSDGPSHPSAGHSDIADVHYMVYTELSHDDYNREWEKASSTYAVLGIDHAAHLGIEAVQGAPQQ